jgi:hypothetical protein
MGKSWPHGLFQVLKMPNGSAMDVRYQLAEILMTLVELNFQAAKMLKGLSQGFLYPWAEGLTNRQESHFQATKMPNIRSPVPNSLQWRILWHVRKHFLRSPKWWKVAHRKTGSLQPMVSWTLRYSIFSTPKFRKGAPCMPDNLETMISWPLRNYVICPPKCRIQAYTKPITLGSRIYPFDRNAFTGLKMHKLRSTESRYPWALESQDPAKLEFSGLQNAKMAFTRSQATLRRVSHEPP